jgi:hypothetical protein
MNKENLIKYVPLALLVLVMFQTCGTKSKLNSMQKDIDSLTIVVKNTPTKNDLIIEGLKNEKRMIQATDRKLLDVKRQSEIDAEISSLQNKK